MNISMSLDSLEDSAWTREWSTSINPIEPEGYEVIPTSDGIRLYTTGAKYAGWLAKCVSPFPYPFTKASLSFSLLIDDCVAQQAQGVEFDSKFTDDDGWTYDGSGVLEIPDGWVFNIGNPWKPTTVKIAPLVESVWMPVRVNYGIDYVNHALTVLALTTGNLTQTVQLATGGAGIVPAQQIGWDKNQIVTQFQPCNNGLRGAQSWKASQIKYILAA